MTTSRHYCYTQQHERLLSDRGTYKVVESAYALNLVTRETTDLFAGKCNNTARTFEAAYNAASALAMGLAYQLWREAEQSDDITCDFVYCDNKVGIAITAEGLTTRYWFEVKRGRMAK